MRLVVLALAAVAAMTPLAAAAQAPVTAVPAAQQAALLRSSDPKLAANKKLVYDMWRTFIDALRVDEAPTFFTERYIQHNPMVPSGRAPAVAFFKTLGAPKPVAPAMTNLVAITAEGDLVTIATRSERKDKAGKTYTTTWFDMYRIVNGKIDEHWDPMTLP